MHLLQPLNVVQRERRHETPTVLGYVGSIVAHVRGKVQRGVGRTAHTAQACCHDGAHPSRRGPGDGAGQRRHDRHARLEHCSFPRCAGMQGPGAFRSMVCRPPGPTMTRPTQMERRFPLGSPSSSRVAVPRRHPDRSCEDPPTCATPPGRMQARMPCASPFHSSAACWPPPATARGSCRLRTIRPSCRERPGSSSSLSRTSSARRRWPSSIPTAACPASRRRLPDR